MGMIVSLSSCESASVSHCTDYVWDFLGFPWPEPFSLTILHVLNEYQQLKVGRLFNRNLNIVISNGGIDIENYVGTMG